MGKNNNYKRTNLYSPSDTSIAFILALIVPQILMVFIYYLLGKDIAYSTLVASLVPQVSFLAVFFYVSERRKVNYKEANQFNFKLNIWVLILVIAIGLIAIFGFTPLTSLFDYITYNWGYKGITDSIDVSSFWSFFATIFYVALLPAICEELIFRGIITNGLKKYGTAPAVMISSVLFALMHQNLQQLIYQLFLGAVMAYIVIKTGSIFYTMILHFFNNFTILLLAHLSNEAAVDYSDPQYAEYYSKAWNVIWPILLSLLAISVIVGLLFLINFIIKKQRAKQLKNINDNINTANLQNQTNVSVLKNDYMKIENADNNVQNLDESKKQDSKNSQNVQNNSSEQSGVKKVLNAVGNAFNEADEHQKFYQNPFIISAIVIGLIFWVLTVISLFQ